MKRKDRRVRLFLEFFFLAAGLYVILVKGWGTFLNYYPGNLFVMQQGSIPVFPLISHLFTGLSCLVSAAVLWSRASWGAGWCLFTFGLLLYGNLQSIGSHITEAPAQTIPMIVIVLVVMQSFPYLIKETGRFS